MTPRLSCISIMIKVKRRQARPSCLNEAETAMVSSWRSFRLVCIVSIQMYGLAVMRARAHTKIIVIIIMIYVCNSPRKKESKKIKRTQTNAYEYQCNMQTYKHLAILPSPKISLITNIIT